MCRPKKKKKQKEVSMFAQPCGERMLSSAFFTAVAALAGLG